MHRPVYIHAAAALGPHGDCTRAERRTLHGDPPPLELKELVKTVVGVPLRQASHHVELAAVGSQLCLRRLSRPAPENTAVYLGTGLAEVRKNEAIFVQIMPPGPGMASPFDFINAANNMTAFYTAKLGNFRARNLTITQEEFSFEWALHLATADLRSGEYHQALVGGVDENSQPRANHLRRIRLRDDQVMGEGSGWLYLDTRRNGARGEVLAVRNGTRATDLTALVTEAVHAWRQGDEEIVLLPGFRLESAEIELLAATVAGLRIQDYRGWCGCFHTGSAFGLATAFDEPRATPALVLHLNRNIVGHTMLVALRAFASPTPPSGEH